MSLPRRPSRPAASATSVSVATSSKRQTLALFAPLAPNYERWATVLSLGQDPRWRRAMVAGLELDAGARVLDVAAGTGAITRLLQARGCDVTALDQSAAMLTRARERGATAVLATAERLPFLDATFDGVTFSYLLRYVADPADCMRELVRVLRPEGVMGMVEFGRPARVLGAVVAPLHWPGATRCRSGHRSRLAPRRPFPRTEHRGRSTADSRTIGCARCGATQDLSRCESNVARSEAAC